MKDNVRRMSVCPICNKTYLGRPALSRTDNRTPICPECGTRQALEAIGVDRDEQDRIIEIIENSNAKLHN